MTFYCSMEKGTIGNEEGSGNVNLSHQIKTLYFNTGSLRAFTRGALLYKEKSSRMIKTRPDFSRNGGKPPGLFYPSGFSLFVQPIHIVMPDHEVILVSVCPYIVPDDIKIQRIHERDKICTFTNKCHHILGSRTHIINGGC